jgi:hypothetical protein
MSELLIGLRSGVAELHLLAILRYGLARYLRWLTLLVPVWPMYLIVSRAVDAGSDAVWYGFWPAFLVGTMVIALAFPDQYKSYCNKKFVTTSVLYLVFMILGFGLA